MKEQELLDKILQQMNKDVEMGDLTAIEEFLKQLLNTETEKIFNAYLSEID